MSRTLPPSEGYLPVRELRRRLREVYAASVHIRIHPPLPVDNVHNRIVTLYDIANFIQRSEPATRLKTLSLEPPVGEENVEWRKITAIVQRRLSDFFRGWDSGALIKARIGDEWKIVNRHGDAALAQMVAPSGAQIACQADFNTGTLRVR